MDTSTKKKKKSVTKSISSNPYKLILHNDDYNTFSHVIDCLIKICEHNPDQANQCAHIIHFNGKCDVKYGYKETLIKMKEKLINNGLIASIEEN